MKRWMLLGSVGAAVFAAATLSAQSSSSSGSQSTSSGGQSSGSMRSTPAAGSSHGSRESSSSMSSNEPMSAADCANDGWKIYTSHRFKSQKACESYVKKQSKRHHATKGTGSTSGSSTSRTPAPPQQ